MLHVSFLSSSDYKLPDELAKEGINFLPPCTKRVLREFSNISSLTDARNNSGEQLNGKNIYSQFSAASITEY